MAVKAKEEVTVRRGDEGSAVREAEEVVESAMAETTVEDVKAMVEAQLQSAYEKAAAQQQQEIAEPEGLFRWDVLGFGPLQFPVSTFPGAPPYLPHQVIRVGESFFVATILLFGPAFTSILTPFRVPYEITYDTGEKKKWAEADPSLETTGTGNLIPGQPFVVNVVRFTPRQAGLYEMNICARILDCYQRGTPPFSGFARRIQKIEPLLFQPQPLVGFDHGMLFQVYD